VEEHSEQNNPPDGEPQLRSLRDFFLFLARLLFGGIAFVTLLGLFARWSSFAEITVHFRAVYACAALVAVGLAAAARSWRLGVMCAVLLAWELAGILPWYVPSAASALSDRSTVKVLTSNVEVSNTDYGRLLDVIAREAPDVVFVQEVTPAWFDALVDTYPYRVQVPHSGYFGLGLYSRFPVENVQSDDPVGRDVPILRADIEIDGQRVRVVNVHIPSPEGRRLIEIRVAQYHWLSDYVANLDGPVLIAGDFNCTMWSPLYKDVVKAGQLANARRGQGILPSWFPLGRSLSLLPLDQILGRGFLFTDAWLGDSIGSDHRPFIAELKLPPR
jgi:endonuclease/exonuclease/phosphatase (EEP) superfamily protein YafD